MEPAPIGESIVLVLRVHSEGGSWVISVDSADAHYEIPLAPAILVLQLKETGPARLLRGTLQLHGTNHVAAVQSSARIVDLVHDWLLPDKHRVME